MWGGTAAHPEQPEGSSRDQPTDPAQLPRMPLSTRRGPWGWVQMGGNGQGAR